MTITTVQVAISAFQITGAALANARVHFALSAADIQAGIVAPAETSVTLDANGIGAATLFANAAGTQGTQYGVTIYAADGSLQFSGAASVPANNCNLHDVLNLITPAVNDAQVAVNLARAWAVQDPVPVDGVDYSAKHHAAAARADRQQADLDAQATASDRTQTGIDRAAADADAAATNSNMLTATAQASLAAGYAASAASVAQQDLSGATAAALHRSPNAVVAMTIDDPRTWSDGGACLQRLDNLSWMNETLNGKWLGSQASEAAARAVSGATTGDYFQLTTDGKFYKLNAGAGTTEVFRGNVAKYGRTAWVAEAARVVGYAIDQPGRPMWKVYPFISAVNCLGAPSVAGIACKDGKFLIAGNAALVQLRVMDLVLDKCFGYGVSGNLTFNRVWDRALDHTVHTATAGVSNAAVIVNNAVNAVGVCTMPDAPYDPVTGLQVPTIAVATAGGLSVIQNTGAVVNSASTTNFNGGIALNPYMLAVTGGGSSWVFALKPGSLGASFALTSMNINTAPGFQSSTNAITGAPVLGMRAMMAARQSGPAVGMIRINESTPAASLVARLVDTYNTGWMTGDIRRCLMADTVAGVANPGDLIADRSYKATPTTVVGTLTKTAVAAAAQLVFYSGWSAANYAQEAYSADLDPGTGQWHATVFGTIPSNVAAAGWAFDRSAAGGAYYRLGCDATGHLVAELYDGTTTRTVTSPAAYNTAQPFKASASYTTDGTLTLSVNGAPVATATGAPLLTLTNAAAVLTIGNRRALDAAWPGSLALLKLGATVPTADASAFMYAQEAQMFQAGAQITLPDSGAVVDMDYDPVQDKWKVVSATNESSFVGLVRTTTAPVSAGSFTKAAHRGGIKLLARSTTNPGVDITIPAKNALEEFNKRAEDAAKLARAVQAFDYTGAFTATTALNSTALTSVAGLVVPSGATILGATISGAGIPANTTVAGVSGSTIYMSAPATAAASGVVVSFTDLILPVGYEAAPDVFAAGALKREGSAYDYTRLFDGFRERVHFAAAPGNVNARVNARRMA